MILPLTGTIQHYYWGGYEFIPGLLGIPNEDRLPFAELWLGAHPKAPALAGGAPLDGLIEQSPEAILGRDVAARFGGRLPFLLKVLDARELLSIQAHPDRARAAAGFARENAAGIPFDAGHRQYRDANHKPEMHVALTDVWMLHGFRPAEEVAAMLRTVPEFSGIEPGEMRELYGRLMLMPDVQVDRILTPLVLRLQRERPADPGLPDFWALRASAQYRDRGLFSIYLLNLIRVPPGHATYQAAGVLHAFLEGTTVELMANSDNVLRGGLTPKYIDVPELLAAVDFRCGKPEVMGGNAASAVETLYRAAADEFQLSRLVVDAEHQSQAEGPEILLVMEGAARIGVLDLTRGASVLVTHGQPYQVSAAGGRAVLFKASVP